MRIWTKETDNHLPGQHVSVDQPESSTPGLIAHLLGIPTKKRYQGATVVVERYSGLSYTHLQKTLSGDKTVSTKEAFKRYARSHGVQVTHYHADNEIFANNKWQKACTENGQRLTFCGVNASSQNGIAEWRIRELQEQARMMLIHINKRWPTTVNAYLWPYAGTIIHQTYNGNTYRLRPFQEPRFWSHFGCPVYVLDKDLQAGKKIGTVALVLSLDTGMVLPQFHLRMDPSFRQVK